MKIHAAGRDHRHLRQRSLESLDVLGTAEIAAREYFHEVGPRLPRRDNFGRRECASHHRLALSVRQFYSFEIETGTDEKLGARIQASPGRLNIEDSTCADRHVAANRLHQL